MMSLALVVLAGAVSCTTANDPLLSGMSVSERPLTGKVIWNDLITEDLVAAKVFYAGMFDWTFEEGRAKRSAEGEVLPLCRENPTTKMQPTRKPRFDEAFCV